MDDCDRTAALANAIWRWGIVLAIDLVWSLGHTLWPREREQARQA